MAVLDTGIDTDHPDLEPNVYKSDDKPNNGKDDDKNGYVDDNYGWNVIKGKGSGEDDNGHGTHVSGIVAGRGNNANGSSGICWSAKLVAVRFMNSKGKGSTSDAIDGIDYAVKNGAKIVNCSFGSRSKSSALHDAVNYAQDHNVLLVVAAGNDGENIDKNPVYPASYTDSNILAVAASTDTDTLASFSNFGSTAVDVAAPGGQHLLHLPRRRLQVPVRHLDGRPLRRRHGRAAAQAGVRRHLRRAPQGDPPEGRQAARAEREGGLRRPPQRAEGAGGDRIDRRLRLAACSPRTPASSSFGACLAGSREFEQHHAQPAARRGAPRPTKQRPASSV